MTPQSTKKSRIPESGMPDRRTHRRYGFTTNLRYRLIKGDSQSAWKKGRTLDMSAGGFRMSIQGAVPDGSFLEVVMDWSGLYHDREHVRLRVEGQVARSEPEAVAVRILRHEFQEGGAVIGTRLRAKPSLAVA